MSSPPLDPLDAVDLLAGEISGADSRPAEISRLIRAIDTLVYALHGIDPDVAGSEEVEAAPEFDYRQAYQAIKRRYPNLGHYWLALHAVVEESTDGELAIGDPIDDLAEIFIAVSEAGWLNEHVGRRAALAAVRAEYDAHLWMHVHSLRQYLEEMRHDG